jgi:tRNA(Ile)-lysidine synthase
VVKISRCVPYYYPVRETVLRYIREQRLMRAGDRVAVAVSGGADSLALLRLLLELQAELGIVLAVAHFHHGLRGAEADADEAFVTDLAKHYGLDFFAGRGNVRDRAFLNKLSIEAAGRELRYRWFAQLAEQQHLDSIATAHTSDDQAETVLLKFLRGAGTRGLAGIYPLVKLEHPEDIAKAKAPREKGAVGGAPEGAPLQNRAGAIRVVRPLLSVSRREVETYLTALGQSWREDASNLDPRFLRNRIRHELLPLLEREYNPGLRATLNDAAEMARGEEEYWLHKVEGEMAKRGVAESDSASADAGQNGHSGSRPRASATGSNRLDLAGFEQLPLALQRRVLKRFAETQALALDFAHIEKLRRCALGEVLRTQLPGGRLAQRSAACLVVCAPLRTATPGYEHILSIPGEIWIAELGLTIRAEVVPEQFARELAAGELLHPALLGAELTVRNWRPGDRFWPAQSRSEEKLKRLFAEKKIPAQQRVSWPVALHEGEIVWARSFPVARTYQWKGEGEAVRIVTTAA